MRLLLDTHSLYWASFEPEKLSREASELLQVEETMLFASLASLWKMAIKCSIGNLKIPDGYFSELSRHGYELLPVTVSHVETYLKLPLIHRDPVDRVLVAQAQSDQMTILTRDVEI